MKNCFAVLSFLSCCLAAGSVYAQLTDAPSQAASSAGTQSPQDQPVKAVVALPQISDEPRTIDPRELLPESLGANVTVDFQSRSLEELVDWMRERGLNVVVQQTELANKGVMMADPISDWVEEAPIHFLLDRLSMLNVGWYVQDDIVCITHEEIAAQRLTTRPFHLGELLDEQFDADELIALIQETIDPESWEMEGDGQGRINQVGDMIFVRNSERNQRSIQALLKALRQHGRQTLIAVPQANVSIREQLSKKVNVRFRDTPLTEALQILSKDAGVDLRLDKKAIRSTRVRESQPVTLQVENAPLENVLNFMLGEIGLTWMIRDGVLWATSQTSAEKNAVTAVYDVRDLSADEDEAGALSSAISEQMPNHWENESTPSRIEFAKPGIMVAWCLESDHAEILRLLESYRAALRSSKARKPGAPLKDEAITLYYRLHSKVAEDLKAALPELVQPDSWQSRNPGAIGTILMLESRPEPSAAKPEVLAIPLVIERKVLVIHQQRSVHEKIAELIRNIENGNAFNGSLHGGGMGGMGGGGFGGGFF